jgi:hypothetical protein
MFDFLSSDSLEDWQGLIEQNYIGYVIQLYIRVSVVLSKSPARREMEKMISNLDSAVGGASWWFRKFSSNVFFQSLQESSGTVF